MMDLSGFLMENAEQMNAEQEIVVSKRFKDAEGRPIPWIAKAISGDEDEAIRKSCKIRVQVRKNQYQNETDTDKYLAMFAVACTVYPNLNSKELQDSYHVMGAADLIRKMLTAGEFANYIEQLEKICGFETLQEEVDQAKNS